MKHLTKIGCTEYGLASGDQLTEGQILDEIQLQRAALAGLGDLEPGRFDGYFISEDGTVAVRGLFAIHDVLDRQVFFRLIGLDSTLRTSMDESGDVGSVILRDGLVINAGGGFFTLEGVGETDENTAISQELVLPNAGTAFYA